MARSGFSSRLQREYSSFPAPSSQHARQGTAAYQSVGANQLTRLKGATVAAPLPLQTSSLRKENGGQDINAVLVNRQGDQKIGWGSSLPVSAPAPAPTSAPLGPVPANDTGPTDTSTQQERPPVPPPAAAASSNSNATALQRPSQPSVSFAPAPVVVPSKEPVGADNARGPHLETGERTAPPDSRRNERYPDDWRRRRGEYEEKCSFRSYPPTTSSGQYGGEREFWSRDGFRSNDDMPRQRDFHGRYPNPSRDRHYRPDERRRPADDISGHGRGGSPPRNPHRIDVPHRDNFHLPPRRSEEDIVLDAIRAREDSEARARFQKEKKDDGERSAELLDEKIPEAEHPRKDDIAQAPKVILRSKSPNQTSGEASGDSAAIASGALKSREEKESTGIGLERKDGDKVRSSAGTSNHAGQETSQPRQAVQEKRVDVRKVELKPMLPIPEEEEDEETRRRKQQQKILETVAAARESKASRRKGKKKSSKKEVPAVAKSDRHLAQKEAQKDESAEKKARAEHRRKRGSRGKRAGRKSVGKREEKKSPAKSIATGEEKKSSAKLTEKKSTGKREEKKSPAKTPDSNADSPHSAKDFVPAPSPEVSAWATGPPPGMVKSLCREPNQPGASVLSSGGEKKLGDQPKQHPPTSKKKKKHRQPHADTKKASRKPRRGKKSNGTT